MNWKKLYRIYREEGLTVRKRGGRKRALGTRSAPMTIPQGPNQRWSLDFVSDSLLPLDGVDAPSRHRCAKVAVSKFATRRKRPWRRLAL